MWSRTHFFCGLAHTWRFLRVTKLWEKRTGWNLVSTCTARFGDDGTGLGHSWSSIKIGFVAFKERMFPILLGHMLWARSRSVCNLTPTQTHAAWRAKGIWSLRTPVLSWSTFYLNFFVSDPVLGALDAEQKRCLLRNEWWLIKWDIRSGNHVIWL